MTTLMRMDYAAFTYLAVTLTPQSPHISAPNSLAQYSGVEHVGKVGELDDVQLYSVPKNIWTTEGTKIVETIRAQEGVTAVDVQIPKTRTKRGAEL